MLQKLALSHFSDISHQFIIIYINKIDYTSLKDLDFSLLNNFLLKFLLIEETGFSLEFSK